MFFSVFISFEKKIVSSYYLGSVFILFPCATINILDFSWIKTYQ